MRSRIGLGLAAAIVGAAACGDASDDACGPDLSVTATASVAPTFTWSPDCVVGRLSVTTEPGDHLWSIVSEPTPDFTPTNLIRSGVVYGEIPANAQQFSDLEPLAAGQTYRVLLRISDGRGGSTLVGTGLFTTPPE